MTARSVFEIVGPIMIGPSSSHTAGMVRIGMMAHRIINETPCQIRLELSPKMKTTYAGHRSDAGLIGGALGLRESDEEIRGAIQLAHNRGIATAVGFLPEGQYPQNTAKVSFFMEDGRSVSITGTSVGGGSIQILEVDGVPVQLEADACHAVIWSRSPVSEDLFPAGARHQAGTRQDGMWVTCVTSVFGFSEEDVNALRAFPGVEKLSVVQPVLEYGVSLPDARVISSCEEICRQAAEEGVPLSEIAIRYEMGRSGFSREAIVGRMEEYLAQMKRSVEQGRQGNNKLQLASGRDAKMLSDAISAGKTISGGIIPTATAMALAVMEYNGSMGCIVAAPTAGSSGIMPGCMVAVQQAYLLSDEKLVNGLFTSALMGIVMAGRDVSFSGSVGGCQGEVGVSSAIAAAGLASLFSDEPQVACHAMALCMKNLLGLVCDPIAGPVEIPCIKRNAVGVANAFISADMALAGIESFIPPDEVIDALVDVEKRLPAELKCATVGGLASTCTACRVRERERA